jgi:sodium-dependent dicarboxylate transporter 2/3/5
MMIPIMSSAIASSDGILTKKYTYMPIGFAAVAGGGLTLIGSTPQIIAQGILIEANLKGASFYEYLWTGIPKVLILLVYFMTFGYYLIKKVCTFPEKVDDLSKLKEKSNLDDKLTIRMIISILILLGCVIGFLIQLWTFGMVAMLGAALCIITKCIPFKSAFKNLDWNTIILVASALSFAACLDESGAGIVMAESIIKVVGENANPLIILSIVGILSSLLGNLVSASAATPILAPICLFMAPAIGLNPRSLIIAVVVFSSIVYTSPTSTPPNTMPLVAGYRYMDYVKVGGLLNIITVILSIIIFPMLYNL